MKTKQTIKAVLRSIFNLLKAIWFSITFLFKWLYKEFPRTYKQGFIITWLMIGNIVAFYFCIPIALANADEVLNSVFFIPTLTKTIVVEKVVEKEMVLTNSDAWVANRVALAGLNVKEAFVIQKNESGYNNSDNKVGLNSNTVDLGRWQINSQHYGKEWTNWLTGETNKLTLACVSDYKCSTDWSISKRLNDTNWGAWYGAKKAGIR